ncbi:MAG TPA: TonB family protein [Pyrinomonadaceae bacterium]|jgi:protein TonB
MSYRIEGGFLLTALLLTAFSLSARAQGSSVASSSAPSKPQAVSEATADSDRLRDGLAGPVRRVRTEVAKLSSKGGKTSESARALLETASYDIKGNKSENAYYPVAGETLTGREVYKYDERGNISEMTLHASDGSLVSKETYTYEFDFVGNWTKMTTSIAVVEGGKLTFEPTEVTYRTISYYLDENMARMVQPATGAAATSAPAPSMSAPAAAHANVKPEPTAATVAATQKTGASSATPKGPALPAANTLDKINMAPAGNLGGSVADSGAQATTGSMVVKVDGAGEPPIRPKPLTKPVSGGVLNGSAIEMPKPEYPEIARRARVTGTISVEIVIDETGKVISAHAASGPPLLREAAIKAAVRARFTPTKLSGQPVKITGTLNYRFSYDN